MRRHTKGIALISVLWIVALLTVVATGLSASVRFESRAVANLKLALQAQYAVESAVDLAALNLMYPQSIRWPVDGSVQEINVGDARVRIAIWDVTGKVDLNHAPMILLRNLLLQAEVDPQTADLLADAILDWRDDDDFRHLNGAEDSDYRIAGLPYGAKDAPFHSVDELQLVLGMTDEIFTAIQSSLTVFSGQGGVNVQHASPQVAAAAAGLDQLNISTSGTAFTVHAEARVAGSIVSQAEATINITYSGVGRPFQILQWRRPDERLFAEPNADGFQEAAL
jgi:general secretion pathway protein K